MTKLYQNPDPCNFIGIDPGVNGAIVVLRQNDVLRVHTWNEEDHVHSQINLIFAILKHGPDHNHPTRICVEQVGGFIGTRKDSENEQQKKNIASAHTMFKFGMMFGAVVTALVAEGLNAEPCTTYVRPQKWQKALGIPPHKKGESQTAFKTRLYQVAKRISGSGGYNTSKIHVVKPIHLTKQAADAFLLLHYCRILHGFIEPFDLLGYQDRT